jgi:hypothetical protein
MTALRAERLRASSIEGKGSLDEILDVEPAVTRPLNLTGIDGLPFADICGRVENDPIAALHAIADLDRRAAIANHGEPSDVDGASSRAVRRAHGASLDISHYCNMIEQI